MTEHKPEIHIRPAVVEDLECLFEFQLDKEASYLAAFTPANQTDKAAWLVKHSNLLKDPGVNYYTILVDTLIAGSVSKFLMDGHPEITYWLDKRFWGQGIATKAVRLLLAIERVRPIFARVAFDNIGSQKVLEHSGFVRTGSDKGFANARQMEIEEYIYKLDEQELILYEEVLK